MKRVWPPRSDQAKIWRQKDQNQKPFLIPKGLQPLAQGLRVTSYPGFAAREDLNPNGVVSCRGQLRHNPVGVADPCIGFSQGSFVPRNPGLWARIPLGFPPPLRLLSPTNPQPLKP